MTSLHVVLPCLNEEKNLAGAVVALSEFLSAQMDACDWFITIADNGSTDASPTIGRRLAAANDRVRYLRLDQRGRGGALKRAWREIDADVAAYIDVDLSTDLRVLPALVSAIADTGYDAAVGSRLRPGAQVLGRSFRREWISRGYSLMVRGMFCTRFVDPQCGFKAVSRRIVQDVLPLVRNTNWFFDSELLILCEKNGYSICELPVRWVDDQDSRVWILHTAREMMTGLLRLRFGGLRRSRRALRGACRSRPDDTATTGRASQLPPPSSS